MDHWVKQDHGWLKLNVDVAFPIQQALQLLGVVSVTQMVTLSWLTRAMEANMYVSP